MKSRSAIGAYLPHEIHLHALPVSLKGLLLLAYFAVIVALSQLVAISVLIIVLVLGQRVLLNQRLAWQTIVFAILMLGVLLVPESIVYRFAVLFFKVTALNLVLKTYLLITPPHALLDWVRQTVPLPMIHELTYLISTTMTLYPTLQHDFGLARDAEHLRMGRPVAWYRLDLWYMILHVTLFRAEQRAYAMGKSAIERGFTIETPFTALDHPSRIHAGIVLVCLVPLVLAGGVERLL